MSSVKKVYSLQHKYPWGTEWEDMKNDNNEYNENFHNILKNEPPHLVEVEYRIIKKTLIKLKSTGKKAVRPEPALSGKDLVAAIIRFEEK